MTTTVAASDVKLNSALALWIAIALTAESLDADTSPFVRLEIPNTALSIDWLISDASRENENDRTAASETVEVSAVDLLRTRSLVAESVVKLTSDAVADRICPPAAESDVKDVSDPARWSRNDLVALSEVPDTSDADLWMARRRIAESLLNVVSVDEREKIIAPRLALSEVLLVSDAEALPDPPCVALSDVKLVSAGTLETRRIRVAASVLSDVSDDERA